MGLTTAGLANGGQTAHYQISYDDTFSGTDGLTLAQGLLDSCEADWGLMAGWFSGVSFEFSFPMPVQIVNAGGGASWTDPPDIALPFGYSPTVVIKPDTGATVDLVRYLLVSEVTEMFMASQKKGWYEKTSLFQGADEGSKGEGLSRFLGVQFKIANNLTPIPFPGFGVVTLWLNSGRSNFVDNNPDDNQPDATNGCTTCFLYYLHDQLGFSINDIISAGASTLAGVYTNLTGKTDGWQSFINLVNLHYPSQDSAGNPLTYNPAGDNIFPVPNLHSLNNDSLVSGSTQTAQILTLDTRAPAEVTVNLNSDNPAVLTIQSPITIPVGNWYVPVVLQAAAVTGPAQTVAIHAKYAGQTLSSNVQILPRPSIIAGQVTDSDLRGISDATVMLESDTIILPGLGNFLQLSTDANGFYQTPFIPPHVYHVSAVQSGYVPGEATVTVGEGVPVTPQNFTLVLAKPFTITGKVNDVVGPAIAGATITLSEDSGIGRIQIKTDAAGHYSISMNPGSYNGSYTITAEDAGFVADSTTVTIPNGANITKDFMLIALGSLMGLIADAGNTPIAGAVVSVGSASARSDATGHYTLPGLIPGLNDVRVSAAGFDVAEIAVRVASRVPTTQNFLLIKGSAVITGTVTDGEEEEPLSGVIVHVGTVSTKTDTDGNYTVSNIPAGQVRVTASAKRYQSEHSVIQLSDHQTVHLDFQLYRTQSGRPTRLAKAGAKM